MKQTQSARQTRPSRDVGRSTVELLTVVQGRLKELRQMGYQPGRLSQAISTRGVVEAISDAIMADGEGFARCLALRRLDCSMEWIAIDPRWGWMFAPSVRETAYSRLDDVLRLLSVQIRRGGK